MSVLLVIQLPLVSAEESCFESKIQKWHVVTPTVWIIGWRRFIFHLLGIDVYINVFCYNFVKALKYKDTGVI